MLLLEQNTTRKGQIDKNITQLEFEFDNSEDYKIDGICNSVVYNKKLKSLNLSSLYFLIL